MLLKLCFRLMRIIRACQDCVTFGGKFQYGREWGGLKKKEFSLKWTVRYDEAFKNLLKLCLSFGGLWRVNGGLMQKKWGGNGKKRFSSEMWENIVWGGLWKFCGTLHAWGSYENCWRHVSEYLVNAWLDLATELLKFTPSAYNRSSSEKCQKRGVFYLSKPEIRHKLPGTINRL